MTVFAGFDHLSLSVTDLDRSESFYTDVLDLVRLVDFGDARVLVHPATGLRIALVLHPARAGGAFSELRTGLDHLGLRASSRGDLDDWVERFDRAGVSHSGVQDLPFGQHLNFRDPDGIALELYVPAPVVIDGLAELRDQRPARDDIDRRVREALAVAAAAPPHGGVTHR